MVSGETTSDISALFAVFKTAARPLLIKEVITELPEVDKTLLDDEKLFNSKCLKSGEKIYWPISEKEILLLALKKKEEAIEALEKEEVEKGMRTHIKILHDYNDAKDGAQSILGKMAEINGCTTKVMYEKFDLNFDD